MNTELQEFILDRAEWEFSSKEVSLVEGLFTLEMEFSYKEQVVEVYNGKKFYNDVWEIVLSRGEITMELDYTQGEGWHGEEPLIKNVLYSLLSDYFGYKQSTDFEDYCANYGMEVFEEFETFEEEEEAEDGYNKKSVALYNLVRKQAKDIEMILGEDELEFLSKVYQDY